MCDEVGNLRTAFAQESDGSHFALTVLFHAGSIGWSRRRALRTKSNVSIYATQMEDGARMTSEAGVMVLIIYH